MSAPQLPSEEIRKQLVDLESESEQKVGRIVSLTTRLEELKSKLHTATIESGALQSSISEAQADIDRLHEDITRIQDYVALISLHLFLFCFFAFFLFFFLRTTNPFSTQGKFPNRKEPLFRSRVSLYWSCCPQGLRGEPPMLLPPRSASYQSYPSSLDSMQPEGPSSTTGTTSSSSGNNQTQEQSPQSELHKQKKGELQQRFHDEAQEMHRRHREDSRAMKDAHKAQNHQLNQEVREQWEQRRLQKQSEAPQGTSSSLQNPASEGSGRGEKRLAGNALNDFDGGGTEAQEGDLHVGVSPLSELSQQETTTKRTKVAKEDKTDKRE